MPDYSEKFSKTVLLFGRVAIMRITITVVATFLSAVSLHASTTARLCDQAAHAAAKLRNVPFDVLHAISRAETGRNSKGQLEPWPWTVNMEGTGKWFATEDEARAYVFRNFKRGARSFDIGCFQVNYKWHGAAFRSIDDMFDPVLNADYAAKFLQELYQEFGTWSAAAGAYHSRTQTHARTYAARFDKIRAAASIPRDLPVVLEPSTNHIASPVFVSRVPSPLISGGAARLGSLVPFAEPMGSNSRSFALFN